MAVVIRDKGKITGSSAAAFGCIASFENADGLVVSRHAAGPPVAALRMLCDHAASIDPSYRLVGYSTPNGILTDLRGRGVRHDKSGQATKWPTPEANVLSRAGRIHMLHPRLAA